MVFRPTAALPGGCGDDSHNLECHVVLRLPRVCRPACLKSPVTTRILPSHLGHYRGWTQRGNSIHRQIVDGDVVQVARSVGSRGNQATATRTMTRAGYAADVVSDDDQANATSKATSVMRPNPDARPAFRGVRMYGHCASDDTSSALALLTIAFVRAQIAIRTTVLFGPLPRGRERRHHPRRRNSTRRRPWRGKPARQLQGAVLK